MAALFARTSKSLPLIAGATLAGSAAVAYTYSKTTLSGHQLDSAQNAPSKLLTFPKSMLFPQTLTVTKTEQINHDTKRITFSLPGGENQISGVPAGSAILTQHSPSGRWFPILRPYTPISDPSQRGSLQLLVKQYPGGAASTHLHNLSVGQTLAIRGPLPGGYIYSEPPSSSSPRELIFIAGGAGITPIYSLARSILLQQEGTGNDRTRIHLVWGVNGARDVVLRSELEDLQRRSSGRLRVTICVSGDREEDRASLLSSSSSLSSDAMRFRRGYVDEDILGEIVGIAKESGRWGDDKGTKVWLCGPEAMEKSLVGRGGILAELGVDKIHKF